LRNLHGVVVRAGVPKNAKHRKALYIPTHYTRGGTLKLDGNSPSAYHGSTRMPLKRVCRRFPAQNDYPKAIVSNL
jgi:hypothetical protein